MHTDCEATIREVCGVLGAELVKFNGEPDHVHLLVRYPPALPLSELVRRLKGATARRMRQDYTGRCNRARMHGHFWTPSHFAVSAGGAPLAIIKKYLLDVWSCMYQYWYNKSISWHQRFSESS
jgi:putative transposase